MVHATIRRARLAVAVACALVAFPAAAMASRTPGDAELGGITTAAVTDCELHQSDCALQGAIVSDVDDEYAWASARGATADYDALLSSSGGGAGDWTVIMVQTQPLPRGCIDYDQFEVPAQVLNDLDIQGLKPGSSTPVTCGTPAAKPKVCSDVKVKAQSSGVSILRTTCAKARALVSQSLKRAGKAPSGWAWLHPSVCSSVLVPKKYRSASHPLLDVPKSKPVIFVDDLTTPACTDAGAETPAGTQAAGTPVASAPVTGAPTVSSS